MLLGWSAVGVLMGFLIFFFVFVGEVCGLRDEVLGEGFGLVGCELSVREN